LVLKTWLRLETEAITEEGKMGLDAQKRFVEMDKYHNMCDRIRVKMVELKTVNVKNATKEIRGGEGQSPFNKMLE
jgi:hypothetical protein